MKAIGTKIIIKLEEEKQGIVLAPSRNMNPLKGKVTSVGRNVEEVVEGITVLFGAYSGQIYEGHIICEQSEILAIL